MNKKRPTKCNKDPKIQQLGKWLSMQQNNHDKNKRLMKTDKIRKKWTEFIEIYSNYFKTNEECWYSNFDMVTKYIDENKKRPSKDNKDQKIQQLGAWISTQQKKYNKKIEIMKNNIIYKKWTDFISSIKYGCYFKNQNINEQFYLDKYEPKIIPKRHLVIKVKKTIASIKQNNDNLLD